MEYVQTNTAILNVLWSLTCGRKMHAQQQEFQVEKKPVHVPVPYAYLPSAYMCEEMGNFGGGAFWQCLLKLHCPPCAKFYKQKEVGRDCKVLQERISFCCDLQ